MPGTLTEQVIALASRPGGMETADVPGYSQRQASQAANRIAGQGRIFVSRVRPRKLRYFGTADEAAAHTANVKNAAAPDQAPHAWRKMRQHAKAVEPLDGCTIDMSRARFTRHPLPHATQQAMQPVVHRMPGDLPFVPRTGSMEFAQWPSRSGNELRYPDGRVETVE